jgi:hypothetical protein
MPGKGESDILPPHLAKRGYSIDKNVATAEPTDAGLDTDVKIKFEDLDTAQRGGLYKIEVFGLLEDMFQHDPEYGAKVREEFELSWDYDMIVSTTLIRKTSLTPA